MNFKWRHFNKQIILTCVRWYLAYPLSYRHIEEMMQESGITIDHATINRWVLNYSPLLEAKARKHRIAVSGNWRLDETYIKVKGKWKYLYRVVDKMVIRSIFCLQPSETKQQLGGFCTKR